MKSKIGLVNKFAYSFFDFAAYKEFLVQGLGKSILYVFLVTLIFSTITNIKTIETFTEELTNVQATLVQSAPNFELKNGILSVDSNKPIFYKHNNIVLIVDTSGTLNNSALSPYSDGFFVNSNELIFRQDYTTIQSIKFTDYNEMQLNNSSVDKILSIIKLILPLVLLVCNPIISFFESLFSGFLVLGPMCIFISSFMGVKLNYTRSCTLSFYAMTLPLLLESLINISGIDISDFSMMFYLISLIYCGLAIRELKKLDKSNLNVTS